MILSIGNSGIWEIEAFELVREELKKKGHEAILFKQDKCLDGEYLIFEVRNNQPVYNIIIDGKLYNIDDFSAIWYLKPHIAKELLTYENIEYRQLIRKQFYVMREALWSVFREKKWINDPWKLYMAESKIYQLNVASKYFAIPNTIITSSPEQVTDFYKRNNGDIVVKLLAVSPIIDKVIYTNRVTEQYMTGIDSVKMSPSIFQEVVKKDYELRITVVGNEIFATKINSQDDPETALDWRKKPKFNDSDVKMEETKLPPFVETKILSYMQSLGLQFGCIDMAVASDGQYIFFEINPNGQWFFIQLRTYVPIAKAIANLLI